MKRKGLLKSGMILLIIVVVAIFLGCDLSGIDPTEDVRVIFYTDEIVSVETLSRGSVVDAPPTPAKTGHTFAGWYTQADGGDLWNFASDVVEDNIVLYAHWTPKQYTVTYMNGGSAYDTDTVDYGVKLTKPTNPIDETKEFSGWYKDTEFDYRWNFTADTVAGNMTLYAGWDVPPAPPEPESGLTAYKAATVGDVPLASPDTFALPDEATTNDVVGSVMMSGLTNTMKAVGVMASSDVDNVHARSISALFRLNVKDEGFVIDDGGEPATDLLEFDIEHMDLEVGLGADKFMQLLLGFTTEMNNMEEYYDANPGGEYSFDYSFLLDIFYSGKFGVSSFLSVKDHTDPSADMAAGLYLDLSVEDMTTSDGTAFTGNIYADLDFSVATNKLTFGEDSYNVPIEVALSMRSMEGIPIVRLIAAFNEISSMESPPTDEDFDTLMETLWDVADDDPFFTITAKIGDEVRTLEDLDVFNFIGGLISELTSGGE